MYIKKLIMFKSKRLTLGGVNHFEYTPDKRIQIIIGTNGVGKSSIVEECSPLPADLKKNYSEGGYKEFHCVYKDRYFIITSGKIKNKHSFKINGDEYNKGGTKKAQLVLVKDYLKYTPEIHNIITGKKVFTNMTATERKQWFSSISTIDLTYPIKVYDKLTSRLRDVNGYLKVLNAKSIEYNNEMLEDTEKIYLTKIRKNIQDTIDFNLLSMSNLKQIVNPKNDILKLVKNLEWLPDDHSDEDTLNVNIIKTQTTIDNITRELKCLNTDLLEMGEINEDTDIVELETTYQKIVDEETAISSTYPFGDQLDVSLLSVFHYTYSGDIIEFLTELQSDDTLSIIELRSLKDDHKKLLVNKDRYIQILKQLHDEYTPLEHLHNSEDTKCPKCNHRWVEGYSESRHTYLKKQISTLDGTLIDLNIHIQKNEELIQTTERCHKYREKLDALLDTEVGRYISEWDTSMSLFNKINFISTHLDIWQKLPKLKDGRSAISKQIENIKDIKKRGLDKGKKDIEAKIHSGYILLADSKKLIETYKNDLKTIIRFKKIYDELRVLLIKFDRFRTDEEVIKIDILRKNVIDILRDEMEKIDTRLNRNEIIEDRLKNHKEEMDEYSDKIKTLKAMIKALSPTEGLIAKAISSYLTIFTDHMNMIIDKVWTYNMEIKPSMITDGGDLDYKFPVVTDNNTVDDVNDTSTGMKEIINLSFKLMSMYRLGLKDYPLILDEFGKSMDPEHQDKAYNFIGDSLIATHQQIFMVSHYESAHGRFGQSDIITLSPESLRLTNDVSVNPTIKIK